MDHGSIGLHSKVNEKLLESSISEFNFALEMEITIPHSFDVAYVYLVRFFFCVSKPVRRMT